MRTRSISRNEASQPPIAKDREEAGIGRKEVYNVVDRAGIDTFVSKRIARGLVRLEVDIYESCAQIGPEIRGVEGCGKIQR